MQTLVLFLSDSDLTVTLNKNIRDENSTRANNKNTLTIGQQGNPTTAPPTYKTTITSSRLKEHIAQTSRRKTENSKLRWNPKLKRIPKSNVGKTSTKGKRQPTMRIKALKSTIAGRRSETNKNK
ncbi:unnamed protein product [Cuscuta europaea]|uniref:Uncharacterized protein n=1 Tax=Cuscuta europaea TaxID=41803 RepID=A0A9P1EA89_CUSEU|nr:unnamed protein product [Cuscuta europaea]